jgi:plastocyanin
MRKWVWVVGVIAAMLVAAGPASGRTFTSFAGEQGQPPADAPDGTTLDAFFPATLTIKKGDRVRVISKSFHTATFLGSANPLDFLPFVPDPAGGTYADAPNDAAGNPFYFEPLTRFIYNPGVFAPSGDTVIDDKAVHNSGILAPGNVTFSFPKAGTYTMLCLFHPGMTQKIVVKGPRATVAGPGLARQRANNQIQKAFDRAEALAATDVPANTVLAGIGGNTSLLAFLPNSLSVPVGTTVTFSSETLSEIHNVAFGPTDWHNGFDAATNFMPTGPGSPNQANPLWIYGSDPLPASGAFSYDGTNHGNGVLATPLMDDAPGDPPQGLPQTFRVTFTAPGTYGFFCQVHPFMTGEVVVTAGP